MQVFEFIFWPEKDLAGPIVFHRPEIIHRGYPCILIPWTNAPEIIIFLCRQTIEWI